MAFWDEFLADADKDTREGAHVFQVTSVVHDAWGDGRARYKFRGILGTASGAKTDLTLSDAPTEDDAKAAKEAGDMKRVRGIAFAYRNHTALAALGKSVATLAEGDELPVYCEKDKEGFIRVSLIFKTLEEAQAHAAKRGGKGAKAPAKAPAASDVPF